VDTDVTGAALDHHVTGAQGHRRIIHRYVDLAIEHGDAEISPKAA
jgi:hypothetical protein